MTPRNVWTALALISAAACGGGGGSTGVTPTGNTTPPQGGVSVVNNAFSPASKTVSVGAAVTWAWNSCTGDGGYGGGETCVAHNVVFDDGATSGVKDQGTYTKTFATAGTYNYHCAFHQAQGMVGSVVVQ